MTLPYRIASVRILAYPPLIYVSTVYINTRKNIFSNTSQHCKNAEYNFFHYLEYYVKYVQKIITV